jgi:hypothetical protein
MPDSQSAQKGASTVKETTNIDEERNK